MTPSAIAAEITDRLREQGSPERAENEKAYLKSDLDFFGVTVPVIRRTVARVAREAGGLDRETAAEAAGELWETAVHECRMAAVELLVAAGDLLGRGDLAMVESMLREARTWALVDPLAATVAGGIDAREGIGDLLEQWAVDPDFWMRRSALLAHLGGLRTGTGDVERFLRFADAMLDEKEFFVRKAIGWCLRELGKVNPAVVAGWLEDRTERVSGVTIREAVKYLSPADGERLMEAYRDRSRAGRTGSSG